MENEYFPLPPVADGRIQTVLFESVPLKEEHDW
jgi:hypothetical protein